MRKARLLRNLQEDIFCRIGVSNVHGVGVIAIRRIPQGIDPFTGSREYREITFGRNELRSLNPGVRKYIADYCYFDGDRILVSEFGLNGLDIPFYVNHSLRPNIALVKDCFFVTTRTIKTGEELTLNYDAAFGGKHKF